MTPDHDTANETGDDMTIETNPAAGTEPAIQWERPGPGTWAFDATHQTDPIGVFAAATFPASYAEGFRRGMALIGSPLETIELAPVNGWLFARIKPLGGPDEPGPGAPPRGLLAVLFRVHPELRRRLRTARVVLDERTWTSVLDDWRTAGRPALRQALDEMAAVDPALCDDAGLAGHIDRLVEITDDALVAHFTHAPVGALVTGELLRLSADHGIEAKDALRTVSGHSDPLRRPTVLVDELAAALAAEGGRAAVDGPADGLFARLAAVGPRTAAALDTYLGEVGPTLAGGFSVADATIGERPELVQALLRHRSRPGAGPVETDRSRAVAGEVEDELARRLPEEVRERWHRAVADARLIAPLRDDDMAMVNEVVGRTRLALLEVGRRLVERDGAVRPSDAVELAPAEIAPTLAGRGVSPDELARRIEERRRQAIVEVPTLLGPPSGPPPIDRFPAPVARVTRAVGMFIERFDAEGDGPLGDSVGHGVSPGRITARAAVVDDLADLDRVEPGSILVTRTTSPTFNAVLAIVSGVVTELGGSVCHAAVMARELGIPGVVGYRDAMSIPDGALVTIDGATGEVVLEP